MVIVSGPGCKEIATGLKTIFFVSKCTRILFIENVVQTKSGKVCDTYGPQNQNSVKHGKSQLGGLLWEHLMVKKRQCVIFKGTYRTRRELFLLKISMFYNRNVNRESTAWS